MKKIYNSLIKNLNKVIKLALTFLCLGIVVQLLIDDDLLGWDPISNIQSAGPSFIGVVSLVVLFLLFNKK